MSTAAPMRHPVSILFVWFSFCSALHAAEAPPARLEEKHRAFFKDYCVECHNEKKQKGKLRLDDISFALDSVENADRWQKILNQINSGEMPPDDEKQPDPTAKANFLDDLSRTLVTARAVLSDSGGKITMRRLNRREYKNTLRDLLGVDINVRELPADGGAGTFDTVGSSLFMSSDQFEQYLALGRQALDEHFARYVAPSGAKPRLMHVEAEERNARIVKSLAERTDAHQRYEKWAAAVEAAARKPENADIAAKIRAEKPNDATHLLMQWQRLQGAPAPKEFGFTDAINADEDGRRDWVHCVPHQKAYVEHPATKTGSFLTVEDVFVNPYQPFRLPGDWPAGDYVVRVRIAATSNTPASRHFLEFGSQHESGVRAVASSHQIRGTMENPQVLEIPLKFSPAKGYGFFFQEKGTYESEEVSHRLFYEGLKRNGIGPEFALWIDWIEVEGPLAPANTKVTPVLAAGETNARKVLETFALRAFRGKQPAPAFLDKLVALHETRRLAGDSFDKAIREPLSVILASPGFLYLQESGLSFSSNQKEEIGLKPKLLSQPELASRLSYFLWSAPPDDALLKADLTKPEVIAGEVDRLIASEKADEFVSGFVHQWLGMDRLDFFQFDTKQFRDFDESTKAAARREVYETLAYLLRHGGSLTQLLKSDEIHVNGLLATYYGIEGIGGDAFQKVKLPAGSPRGGLLGMAAILAMGSNGQHTSPVERGAWVLRHLLHNPPPPAPPNVPQLSRLEGKPLSPRERLAAHMEEAQCASCHRKIDPIGFGLENFNAVGKWREVDHDPKAKKDWPIDPAGAFHNGPAFKDYSELRDLIAAKSEDFAHSFTEALIEYALGRPYGFTDQSLTDAVVRKAKAKDFALRDFILALVTRSEFRQK